MDPIRLLKVFLVDLAVGLGPWFTPELTVPAQPYPGDDASSVQASPNADDSAQPVFRLPEQPKASAAS